MTSPDPAGPLAGIRIIDITTIFLGPYATQMLGDAGADVIKIEAPPRGDSTRWLGRARHPGMGGPFLNLNRNKRSLALDLKQDVARGALEQLVATADVLVHNMRTNAIERLGFGYGAVADVRPDIVYCAAQGYGSAGPYRDRPAYDDALQVESGLAKLFEETAGQPLLVPTILVDKMVGVMTAQAIALALFHRERTGEGQFVEVPMFETLTSFLMVEHIYERAFVPPLGPAGYKRVTTAARKPYRTRDGYACILPYTDRQWRGFFDIAGRPELAQDPRFADYQTRNEHVDTLYGLIAEVAPERTTAEWLALCADAGIPATAANEIGDLFDDEHLRAVGLFQHHDHPSEGATLLAGPPVVMSKSPASIRRPAPRLGQHGEEILGELGYDDDQIAAMRATGAVIGDNDQD